MDRISNADRLILLLRERLLERSHLLSKKTGAARPQGSREALLEGLKALAAIGEVSDQQLGRALVQSILADQFGREMLNEAKFQQIIDRVSAALAEDGETAKLLSRMVKEMRAAAA